MSSSSADETHMRRCLDLARQAQGRTAPNPCVGALVLDASGNVVGEGFHRKAGQPHAEVFAFDQAGEKARGGTLYVSLEPCCHHGRTPPCLDRVLTAGVARVVIGMADVNPEVAGKSIAALNAKGVSTTVGVLEHECRWLNRGFIKRMQAGLPWVALKIAATIDGRIADRQGKSRWITGPAARAYVQQLRNDFDCVLVGSQTVIADDPQLNVRELEGGRNPLRAVIDSGDSCPAQSRIFNDDQAATVVFTLGPGRASGNCNWVNVPAGEFGKVDLALALKKLGEQGVNTVLCEGGGRLAGALLDCDLVDELYWFVAAKLLVDGDSIAAVSGERRDLAQAANLKLLSTTMVGDDVLLTGIFDRR